jgi:predicted transcriptional regulator
MAKILSTTREAAAELGVTSARVRQMILKGETATYRSRLPTTFHDKVREGSEFPEINARQTLVSRLALAQRMPFPGSCVVISGRNGHSCVNVYFA